MKLNQATFIAQGRTIEVVLGGSKVKMWREVNPGEMDVVLGKGMDARQKAGGGLRYGVVVMDDEGYWTGDILGFWILSDCEQFLLERELTDGWELTKVCLDAQRGHLVGRKENIND